MKASIDFCVRLIAPVFLLASCEGFFGQGQSSEIVPSFSEDAYVRTKALQDIPDTNDFVLSVSDSKGKCVFEGSYKDAPQSISVSPGAYSLEVRSADFDAPDFETPVYGDVQEVAVESGQKTTVRFVCRQLNSGVRLAIDDSFREAHPDGVMVLSSDAGSLDYGYDETRTAYFNPGEVSLSLRENGCNETLMGMSLAARDMMILKVSSVAGMLSGSGSDVTMDVDTSRNWISSDYVEGAKSEKGSDAANPLGVPEARLRTGAKGVWVYGYIVGGDMTSSKISFSEPFSSRTHMAISSKSASATRDICLSVQLQKGSIRDSLNLVDNPSRLGSKVLLKGDVVASYYGIPGIQNVTEFKF